MPSGWRSPGPASCVRRWLEMVLLLAVLRRMEPEARSDATPATPSIKLEVEAPNWRDLEPSFSCPSGHGDLQDEGKGSAAPCSSASREASSSCGVPQRRQCYAGVICGVSSHSTPGSDVLPSIFFLLAFVPNWRIFIAFSSGFITDVAPSGMLPGGGAGARSWRFPGCGGEIQGPDGVFPFRSRVLPVKVKAHVVFPHVLRGLPAIMYRQLD